MVAMPRDTIADLFASFAEFDEPFLAYDDGYRSHSYTYRETADAARAFRAQVGICRVSEKAILWCFGARIALSGSRRSGDAYCAEPSSCHWTTVPRRIYFSGYRRSPKPSSC